MKLNQGLVKIVQQELNKRCRLSLKTDGIVGKKTISGIDQVTAIPMHWDDKRKVIGYVQHLCILEGIEGGPVDGYYGGLTEHGYEQLKVKLKTGRLPLPWREEEQASDSGVGGWPIENTKELEKFYGSPGTNQTLVPIPYPVKLAWAPHKIITRFSCHEKVADSIVQVLERVQNHYGDKIGTLGLDMFGGCFNKRKIRGGTRWSTHAFGIAIDWFPQQNKLRWNHTKAVFAKPIYDKWWELWDEVGATSLGRVKDYDWQHVQFARRK